MAGAAGALTNPGVVGGGGGGMAVASAAAAAAEDADKLALAGIPFFGIVICFGLADMALGTGLLLLVHVCGAPVPLP